MISKINPNIKLIPISDEGLAFSTFLGYYTGTLLLHKTEKGYKLLKCEDSAPDRGLMMHDGSVIRDFSTLYRFTVEMGYYKHKNTIFSLKYSPTRTYKKSLSCHHLEISQLSAGGGLRRGLSLSGVLAIVRIALEPRDYELGSDTFCLSNRLAVKGGKVFTFYKNMTIGDYVGGVVKTPFWTVADRINKLWGERVPCEIL